MPSADELLQQLQQQAQVNRAAAIEASEPELLAVYRNETSTTTDGRTYRIAGGVSVPEGTALAANYDPDTGEVVWVESYTGPDGVTTDELAKRVPCANGTDCLDDNFCYGWYECEPCDWCENNQCQPRDPARACAATWECPCPPNEDQHYDCVDSTCRLTCQTNSDCDVDEVCGLLDGYCGPGCETDSQCDPTNPDRVGDAQENTFCVDRECVFPCDPARYCNADSDCFEDEYCGDREFRVASDPQGSAGAFQCLSGCRNDDSCENEGETCDFEDRQCKRFCLSNSDCPEDEECNADGVCSNVGKVCSADADCEGQGYCKDGRCTSGCEVDAHCEVVCDADPNCVEGCPIDPTCQCTGDGCYNENWRDLCPKSPACIAACPEDPLCTRDRGRVCVDGQCERTCTDSSQCLEDEVCDANVCKVRTSSEGVPADDRLGCNCGDVCNQYGTCEPVLCTSDEQCPSCSICEVGVCVEGCSESNPCPENGCCNSDGRCSKSCTNDLDCLSEPGNSVCLEGGCCGFACDPLVPCVFNSNCASGEFCGDQGYCLGGCKSDSDCSRIGDEQDGRFRCVKQYVRARNGALAPCEFFPGEDCFSEIGQCESYCISSADCGEGESCVDGNCESPPEPGCSSDSQCDDGICKNGSCTGGCRFDSQCRTGERCIDNSCKLTCTSDQQCVALQGPNSECVGGTCQSINSGTSGGTGGRKGCECWEFCDSFGYCQPFRCSSDLECEEIACGSCLSNGYCGECSSDSDCPGTKVCDKAEGSETGTCASACTPGDVPGVCLGSSDCPDGFFCEGGECTRGCLENEDCGNGVCRGGQCYEGCTNTCPANYTCVQGACLYAGKPCNTENEAARVTQQRIDYLQERLNSLQDSGDEGDEVDQVQGELDVAQIELDEARNRDCAPGETCEGDQCLPAPPECLADFECEYPALCSSGYCQVPPGSESYQAFDPQVIGCQSCAEFCDNGVCRETRCSSNEDCGCGICGRAGRCIESCQSDFDCISSGGGSGRCISGECVACTSNFDCRGAGPGAICDGGECKTPCGEGLSTGDCFEGLNDGDTCGACPDACPDDAPCRQTEEVCNYQEVYDIREGRMRVSITYCQKCSRKCISSADCQDGTVCGGFGICEPSDGRCTVDSDCYEDALAKGLSNMRCVRNQCIEPGETCFTNSDCDSGEVCDGGECRAGECGDNDPCSTGKTCVDNQCVWECGSAEVYTCRTPSECPPGYSCGCDKGYGGYCIRPGMTCDKLEDPGCPSGTICCGGGCVDLSQSDKQCCEDNNCTGGYKCCDGICRSSCNDKGKEPDENPADETLEKQDNCAAIGKCCGDDGWCEPCGCGPENPCPSGQCCDEGTGICVNRGDHPNTRFGTPEACKYDRTYCKILTWDDNEVVPDNLGDANYKGCEVIDAVNNIIRCWEGADKSEDQIRRLVKNACFKPQIKQCNCDEIPSEDECLTDTDCGSCGKCEEKTFRNDACCGVYGEGQYETGLEYQGTGGLDFVRRRQCVNDDDSGDCGCRSNSDCTECETCQGGGINSVGVCVADCLGRCPCGGKLSGGGECPTCEERYGPCATDGRVEPVEYVDPETGEITTVLDRASCQCGVDFSKNCCQGLQSVEDLFRNRTQCLRKNVVLLDGTSLTLQTETCYDEENDECAQCDVDADCPGPAVCEGYKCVTECGLANSRPQTAEQTTDRQDVGSIGGDPYSCYCCSEAGQCRPLYDNWIESNKKQQGPWTLTYRKSNGLTGSFGSQKNSYEAALAELKAAVGEDVQVVNSEGESNQGECRPCECNVDGINCAAWAKCDGCYAWQNTTPDDENLSKAEKLRLEDAMFKASEAVDENQPILDAANQKLSEKFGAYLSARQTLADQAGNQASELNLLYQQQDAQNEQLVSLTLELQERETEKEVALRNLQRISIDGFDLDIATAQAEFDGASDARDDAADAVDALNDDIAETNQAINEYLDSVPNSDELRQVVDTAYEEFTQANIERIRALDEERYLNEALLKAVENYNAAYYKPAQYRQVRTTNCCIDDQARPDGECVYGTCYLCSESFDGGDYEGNYEAALYGVATGNRVSTDTDYRGWCKPKIEGKTSYKYKVNKDLNCVKAPCGYIFFEQRLGTGTNQRYWEYCKGILGCIFKYTNKGCDNPGQAEYLQGWKYEIFLDEAGTFFTNDFVNWVKVGAYEGKDGERKASCLYANNFGYLGANSIGTFEDLVASHPVCAKAELVHGCPDDEPGCAAALRTYYERGSQDFEIKRLKREIAQLQAYVQALTKVKEELQGLYSQKFGEGQQALSDAETAKNELAYYTRLLEELTANQEPMAQDVNSYRQLRDSAQADYDKAVEDYRTINDAVTDKLLERTDTETEIAQLNAELDQTEKNIISARAQANTEYLAINNELEQLQKLRDQLLALTPDTAEYINKQNEITNKELAIDEMQSEYGALVTEIIALEETAIQYRDETIPEAQQPLVEIESQLAELQNNLNDQLQLVELSKGALDQAILNLTFASQTLLSNNQQIPTVEEQIDYWTDKEQQEAGKADNFQSVLDTITSSIQEVDTAIESQNKDIKKKQDRIAQLSLEEGDPTIVSGPVALPIDDSQKVIRTAKELKEEYEGNVDIDEYLAQQDNWVAGATSEA